MQYSKISIKTNFAESFMADLLVADLGDFGCEMFETDNDNLVVAYIQTAAFKADELETLISDFAFPGIVSYEVTLCEDKDYNAEWEANFEPIIVDERLIVVPAWKQNLAQDYEESIVINPKMAFGTGTHQTTSLILRSLLENDLRGLKVLDMGCGTAILAILASKRGAKDITAIDIDDWCTENAKENIGLNNITNISVELGDARLLVNRHFDLILANINRNILLMDMDKYAACLSTGGELLLSGFYTEDVPILEAKAKLLGMTLITTNQKDNWCMMELRKL